MAHPASLNPASLNPASLNPASPKPTTSGLWSVSIVVGTLVSPPTIRETATGEVGEIDVQSFSLLSTSPPSTSPPSTSPSKVAVSVVGPAILFRDLSIGDEVVIVGTTRRRFFRSGLATVTRTEVEASRVCRLSEKREVKRLFAEVRLQLDTAITTPAGPSTPRRNR